jgi:hypothetical protein
MKVLAIVIFIVGIILGSMLFSMIGVISNNCDKEIENPCIIDKKILNTSCEVHNCSSVEQILLLACVFGALTCWVVGIAGGYALNDN